MSMIRSVDVGRVNYAYCDFCPAHNKIHSWGVFEAPTIHKLFEELDKRPFDGKVVIEAQSKKAGQMLAIQHWTQSYYVLKGLSVIIFSAKHKLKGTGQENSGQGNYRARKKASVALTTAWLQQHPQDPAIHEWFCQTKKKDDGADCFSQALAFACIPIQQGKIDIRPSKIVCRIPNLHQRQTGRYSQSNLKHIILKDWKCDNHEALKERLPTDKKVAKALRKHFKTVEQCWQSLFPISNNQASPDKHLQARTQIVCKGECQLL